MVRYVLFHDGILTFCLRSVDSNDTLYGNEENFMQAIKTLNNEIVELILSDLTTLGEDKVSDVNCCIP